jgi:hypothetical protein
VSLDIFGIVTYAVIIIGLIVAIIWGLSNVNVGEFIKGECDLPPHVCDFAARMGFPKGWLSSEKFIWYAFLPLMGVWLIIYGFLDRIKIFKGSISAVLAFVMAFSTIPLGVFIVLVATLFSIMGTYATFMFVALFIIGTIFFFRARVKGWKAGSIEAEIFDEKIQARIREKETWEKQTKDIRKEMEELTKKAKSQEIQLAEYEALMTELRERLVSAEQNLKSKDTEIKYLKKEKKEYLKRIKEFEKAAKKK